MNNKSKYIQLAQKISTQYQQISSVEAIAISGSQITGIIDNNSDIDLYIYSDNEISVKKRQSIINRLGAGDTNLNITFWDPGDVWIDIETGIEVDVMYWNKSWISDQIDEVIIHNQARLGYTTSFWHTILNSKVLFDRNNWFSDFKERCKISYSDELRNAIIKKNYPVLRKVIPSYYNQIKKAIERKDEVSVNHRIAVFFASYFDIIFAINKIPNPGEKKIMTFITNNHLKKPENLEIQINQILKSIPPHDKLLNLLNNIVDSLDNLLKKDFLWNDDLTD